MKPVVFFRSLLLLTLAGSLYAVSAQGITLPRVPSPQASVSQTIGISTVAVEYSRPSVKGRVIWGELVPFGWNVQNFGYQNSAPWRAGANENTVIKFSHEAMVEGQKVPAGKYGLFFTINADNTGEVILSKDYRSWGSYFYVPDQDQLRASIQLRTIPMTEMLTYDFMNVAKNSAELVLNWEKKQFPVRIEFKTDDIVMKNASEELKGVAGFNWQGFSTAANYALQNKVNIEEAVGWADQAVAANKNFNTLIVKSGLLRHQGNKEEAAKMESEALALGNENEINTYGYQLLGQGLHDEAIRIFIVNTERYPESANTWDSLGEGYAIKGDKENAVKNFKKSLSLNPNEGTKANSIKYLKQLGEM